MIHEKLPPLRVYVTGDQPVTCPQCGARTRFEVFASGLEEHECLNKECRYAFFAEREHAES